MIKAYLKKGALLLAIFAVSTVLLVKGLDLLNTATSRSITAVDGVVTVGSGFDGSLHTVEGITPASSDSVRFFIVSDGRPLSLLLDGLKFGHEIYIDGRLASQNTDAAAAEYDGSYAYKVFDLGDLAAGDRVSVEISGSLASQTKLFLADTDALHGGIELRTICYAFMLTSLLTFTAAALILYFSNKPSGLFLLFAVMGAVSILKSVSLGELFVLAKALGITFRQFIPIDSVTSAVNLILPIFVMLCLFDLYPRKKWRWAAISAAVLLTSLSLGLGYQSLFYLAYARSVYLASVALSIYGCMKNKPFCGIVMFNNILFSSCTFYATFVHSGVFRYGLLDFYVNTTYLGALIYLCVFLVVYIGYSLRELRNLEEQKKRYERLNLLRGISHDLRLPLSVIKMNNQMLEMYPMDADERKECVRMSVDAVRELENMTGNINSYLNLEDPDDADIRSSIKHSFDKIREHYTAYGKGTGIRFNAEWEGEDRMLPVKALLLDRLMYNLVDNAFKYNRPGGAVALACRTDTERVVVTVEDTGVGMDRETVENVFTPFYRSDQSRSKEGFGLGLSVVQGIADSLGGTITVKSDPGHGTRIDVTIPLKND